MNQSTALSKFRWLRLGFCGCGHPIYLIFTIYIHILYILQATFP